MEIRCKYKIIVSQSLGPLYFCQITSASITKPNQAITSIIGKHLIGKTYLDVQGFCISHTAVHYMPKNIVEFFPNLILIQINDCGLKRVTREDFIGFENIMTLALQDNELTLLPDDLFEGMENLKWISFNNNKLEFLSTQLFQPVLGNQLKLVDLTNNSRIHSYFNCKYVNSSFLELMRQIDQHCKKPPKKVVLQEVFKKNFMTSLRNLWQSSQLSDFTIIVGNEKIQVHKVVLGMQSEFFAETFEDELENSSDELKIEALSAESVKEVLRWMYTGEIPSSKNAIEIFALAIKLKISGLKTIAESLCLKNLNQKNAMEIYELGNRFGYETLKSSAFEEIKKFLGRPNLDQSFKSKPRQLKTLVEAEKIYQESNTVTKTATIGYTGYAVVRKA